jgi:hypothetical protein
VKSFQFRKSGLLGLMFLSLTISTLSAAEKGQVPDPEKWYLESYGAMWSSEPWNNGDQTLNFYAANIQEHEPGGGIVSYDSVSWMEGLLAMWKDEGWLGSEVGALRVTRINESTVSFMARWDDRNKGADDEISCGWYLADLMDGQWKFTQYANIDCAEHGF